MPAPKSTKEGPGVPLDKQEKLHLYTMSTPNGKRAQIMLEELAETYGTKFSYEIVDITTNVQKEDWFLKICPNGRIPALHDAQTGFDVMESMSILLYLLKEHDKNDTFGFKDELERNECLQWMAWVVGGIGASVRLRRAVLPAHDADNHFNKFAKDKLPYAIQRYHDETLRLYSVIEDRLTGRLTGNKRQWLAGKGEGKYSVADIMGYPWVAAWQFSGLKQEEMDKFPALQDWLKRIAARPAVQAGTGAK